MTYRERLERAAARREDWAAKAAARGRPEQPNLF